MDTFAKLCGQDSAGEGNVVIDVSCDGSVLAFNDATSQLWKADGRVLQMPNSCLLDAQCYELRLQRDLHDVSLDNLVCCGVKAHPRAAFVLIHGMLVCFVLQHSSRFTCCIPGIMALHSLHSSCHYSFRVAVD